VVIVAGPIVREADGLAMSSRNIYLDPAQRQQALILHRSLQQVDRLAASGERCAARLLATGKEEMAREPDVHLDYFEIVDWETLDPLPEVKPGALVAVAAYVGTTRLIDNVLL